MPDKRWTKWRDGDFGLLLGGVNHILPYQTWMEIFKELQDISYQCRHKEWKECEGKLDDNHISVQCTVCGVPGEVYFPCT